MEAIRNYVEALFAGLPQRGDVLRVKEDMLANLEDKFTALLDEGKNEDEATGIVIASIGSAEELREEYGLQAAALTAVPAAVIPNRFLFVLFLLAMVPLVMIAARLCFTSTLMEWVQVWWLIKYTADGIVIVTGLYRLARFWMCRKGICLRWSLVFLGISLPVACVLYIYLCAWHGLCWEIPLAYFPICCLAAILLEYFERTMQSPVMQP